MRCQLARCPKELLSDHARLLRRAPVGVRYFHASPVQYGPEPNCLGLRTRPKAPQRLPVVPIHYDQEFRPVDQAGIH